MVNMMDKHLRTLGKIRLAQIQPTGLIVSTKLGDVYDPTRRVEVDTLIITPLGIEAILPDGKRALDIHHINHPGKAYDNRDLVSIGFTSHYAAMRERFGEHMADGIAGENIIIDFEHEIWMDDLGQQITIKSHKSGTSAYLDVVRFAAPCREFSHFAAGKQNEKLPAAELKSALHFLHNGRRGFLLVLSEGQGSVVVEPGDEVFGIVPD